MARKAINGYPEKSYYDNTVFGGIVATSDPLNEGSFALLSNLDITDSGKSAVPRKGYLSTTFTIGGVPTVLSDKIVMFRDNNTQKDIVIDFNKIVDDTSKFAYMFDISTYNIINSLLTSSENRVIQNYDFTGATVGALKDVVFDTPPASALKYLFDHTRIIEDNNGSTYSGGRMLPIRDNDGVIYHIIKLEFEHNEIVFNWWLKALYRQNETTVGGVTYQADTLVLDMIDFTEQTDLFSNRNIASSVSIIPDPLRVQEDVGVLNSEPSEVDRPILLKFDSKYATKNIPISYKTNLDINVVPTFYLQDPSVVLSSADGKWGYRFDFIRTNNDNSTQTYKTPWRELPLLSTMECPGETTNPAISELEVGTSNLTDEIYTYYVISEATHSWYGTTGAVSYLTGLEKAEEAMYAKMRANGTAGSSGSALGNLAFAYLKHDTIVSTLKPTSIALEEVDPVTYTQMNFKFISEDDVRSGVSLVGSDLDVLLTRTASLSQSDVDALSPSIYPSASLGTVTAPIFPMTYSKYASSTKMSLEEFITHAKEKQKTKRIKIVFVPFIYRYSGSVSGTVFDMVYLCSLGGIYVNGLKANLALTTGDIAPYDSVKGIIKTFTFEIPQQANYVDVFDDLGNLNIADTLEYIPRSVFDRGIFLVLYLKPYNALMLSGYADKTTQEIIAINASWDESAYKQASVGVWSQERDVVYIDETDEENPAAIDAAVRYIVFEDRLIVWSANKVFISEEGNYHYFTETLKKTFSEEVLKVLPFKTVLLVFTVQNLYAIYRTEIDTFTGAYTAQGLPEFTKAIVWLQQPVLYNINPSRKYLDVIQVYNQMILFYSSEGQLYMIKPSTMIDSETQFGIQYFNKSANNILLNYPDYINQRLVRYGKLNINDAENYVTKDDVQITALVDIDLIKIFYCVPDRITFVLVYDVVNNRYTTYDTISFTNIVAVKHIEGGEFYLTKNSTNSYLTFSYTGVNNVDQNVDMHYARMFRKEPVFGFIDSGNLNLNNHIFKRLRDLRVVLKNIDATKILYNAEILLDDVLIRPFYAPEFRVRMLNGPDSTMVVNRVPVEDANELFGLDQTLGISGDRTDINSYYLYEDRQFFENNALLKTETLNSNKLIEYNSSILSMGKVIRVRLQFISKGKYKLQSFGIIYKERRT